MVDPSDLLLPEGACLLHVGPYKTGSSAIQGALHNARAQMLEYGVVYPGRDRRARHPSWAVLGQNPRGFPAPTLDQWNALAEEVNAAEGLRVCVSSEDFGRAAPEQAARIVADLGGDRVHVVSVARRLDKILPSAWQQRVQSFSSVCYEEFLQVVLDDSASDSPLYRSFWASHNVERLAERWVHTVGSERFLLIVSDDSDRTLLPRTFEQLLGLPTGLLELEAKSNPSLSMNSVELVRRLNSVFAERSWPDEVYHQMIRQAVTPAMKNAPRTEYDEAIPRLPEWAAARCAELSDIRVDALKTLQVRTVGDPDVLRGAPPSGSAELDPPETLSIDSATRAVVASVESAMQELDKLRRQHARAVRQLERKHSTARERQGKARTSQPSAAGAPRTLDDTRSSELLGEVRQRLGRRVRALRRPGEA